MPTEAELAAQKAEQEKKDAEEATSKANADAEAKAEADAKKNDTFGKMFKKGDKKEEGKTVPEAAFLEEKKARKELEKKLKELEDKGASKVEITKSLKEIADKYDVEEDFVADVASAIQSEAMAKVDEKISSRLKPLEEKEQKEQIDKTFKEHYSKALESMPEYKGIAIESVIKALSLDPANAEKTFPQILEETYGHLIKGQKKPVEKVRPKDGGAEPEIDFERAKSDKTYFEQIMADPATKAEYNKNLAKRLKL